MPKEKEYMSKKLNVLRAQEIKTQVSLRCMEQEMKLLQNSNILIDQRLNEIDKTSVDVIA